MELNRIVFIGRTFEEYMAMFSLSMDELQGKKVLDCPAGACSFTAAGGQQGLDITACDIAYCHEGEALAAKGKLDVKHAMESVEQAREQYVWDYFRSVADLAEHRTRALSDCAAHMAAHPERYVPAVLPKLPFQDGEFDLILSAHFLFTYSDRLDKRFHLQVIEELLRVAKEEIRIFPLVSLAGNRYEHLEEIINILHERGCETEEIRVPYEFQRNAHSMLKIRKNRPSIV